MNREIKGFGFMHVFVLVDRSVYGSSTQDDRVWELNRFFRYGRKIPHWPGGYGRCLDCRWRARYPPPYSYCSGNVFPRSFVIFTNYY